MKVVVWRGCTVVSEQTFEAEGPDIHIDPWNLPESVGVRRDLPSGGQVHSSVDISKTAMLG